MDYHRTAPQYTVDVRLSATATYSVEGTVDDVFDPNVTPVAYTLLPSGSGSSTTVLSAPTRAIRLNVTASTGTATMTIVQQSIV